MKEYISEFDQWLRNYKKENPDTENKQREGRSLLWDKHPTEVEHPKSVVCNKQQGYVYYK